MARGEADLNRASDRRAKADAPVRSSNGTQGDPAKVKGSKAPSLSELDKQMMVVGGFKDEAEYIRHRDGNYEISVPLGE